MVQNKKINVIESQIKKLSGKESNCIENKKIKKIDIKLKIINDKQKQNEENIKIIDQIKKLREQIDKLEKQEIKKQEIEKKKYEEIEYKKTIKERYKIDKKDANYAVVVYDDFYKQNCAKFLKYFKTLDEANFFAYSQAEKEKYQDEPIYFFGSKKIANKKAQYKLPENTNDEARTTPYKKQIIAYYNFYIYSVIKSFNGIENEWKHERYPHLTYYPDSYFPSKTVFPIYGDDVLYEYSPEYLMDCVNAKTREIFKVDVIKYNR